MNKHIVVFVVLFCAALRSSAQDNGSLFDFNALKCLARNLSASPHQASDKSLPKELRSFNYDDMRNIRFDPKSAVWRMERLPFQLQFVHRGGPQNGRISVNTIEGEKISPIPFSKNLFDYEQIRIRGRLPDDLGFNGFRIHYPLNTVEYLDEVIAFQGASYFRALGRGLHYGISARGLAINVIGQIPEEFPEFIEYWIEKPDSRSDRIRLYILLDSPSLTGAYEMVIIPGEATVTEIRAALFPRRPLDGLGLAPLTSMFWFGELSSSRHGDFRPEVHDSDGLLIHTGAGEWLWRPLSNEGGIKISCFADENPRGFGLFQRDRSFSSYQDLEAFYHNRPSVWVEPGPDWGKGEIRLIELPTGSEYADNIVACWAPAEPLLPDHPLEFSYRLHWLSEDPSLPPLSRTLATRCGSSAEYPEAVKFVLDFSNSSGLDRNTPDRVTPVITVRNGLLKGSHLQLNDPGNSWRVFFDIEPEDRTRPVEMRCFLQSNGLPQSETWTYYWTP